MSETGGKLPLVASLSMRMSARLKVLAAVVVSYALAFLPLLMLGAMGLWWLKLMLPLSLPLILVAGVVSALFAGSIVRRPAVWSLAALGGAVAVSTVGLYFPTRSWVGLVSVVVAIPAAAIFYLIARVWLRPAVSAI